MTTPRYASFEYRVQIAVSIPIAWGLFLRVVAENHYDSWCRESAKAGVVNALCNTACDGEFPSTHPLGHHELQRLVKIMERARYHEGPAREIAAWLKETRRRLVAREAALALWAQRMEARAC